VGYDEPIEVWHGHGEEVPRDLSAKLAKEGLYISDASQIIDQLSVNLKRRGNDKRLYMLKAVALVYTQFQEVLLLDADNFPVQNPASLFESNEFRKTGALFWPDFWHLEKKNAMWTIIDKTFEKGIQQESGQVLIDKGRHWGSVVLVLYMNLFHTLYYDYTHGDKDTFHFSFRAMNDTYHMIQYPVGGAGHLMPEKKRNVLEFQGSTMVQHAPDGSIAFLHRNLNKWPTGYRPKHEQISNTDRVWTVVKECGTLSAGDAGTRMARKGSLSLAWQGLHCAALVYFGDHGLYWYENSDLNNKRDIANPWQDRNVNTQHGSPRQRPESRNQIDQDGLDMPALQTISVPFLDVVGWDIEAAIMRIFESLWQMAEYQAYMRDLRFQASLEKSASELRGEISKINLLK